MEKSLDNGLFWICLAARYSSMFDEIYWTFIDEAHYGPFTSVEDRVQHLDDSERAKLRVMYGMKMGQAQEGTIDPNYSLDDIMELWCGPLTIIDLTVIDRLLRKRHEEGPVILAC